jgi:predicted N-acetyltransferase YhbS
MVVELRASGLESLSLATALLQRARLADPDAGIWEASDVQWWWRTPRPSSGNFAEARLRQCSLHDPTLDVAVRTEEGDTAAFALFWYDPVTRVGLVEPMRVEDELQRRGIGRALLTAGLDRLARRGARRLKVGYGSGAARSLYVGAGFRPTATMMSYRGRASPVSC